MCNSLASLLSHIRFIYSILWFPLLCCRVISIFQFIFFALRTKERWRRRFERFPSTACACKIVLKCYIHVLVHVPGHVHLYFFLFSIRVIYAMNPIFQTMSESSYYIRFPFLVLKKWQEQPIQHGFAYISGYNVYLHCFFSILCLQLFAFVYVLILILLDVQMKRSLLSRCEVNF